MTSSFLSRHLTGCSFRLAPDPERADHVRLVAVVPRSLGDEVDVDEAGAEADQRLQAWCVHYLLTRGAITLEVAADTMGNITGASWARRRVRRPAEG